MSCVGNFENHKWDGGTICVREGCRAMRSVPSDSADVTENTEALDAIEQREAGEPAESKKSEASKWTERKNKKAAEDKLRRKVLENRARNAVNMIQAAKASAAAHYYNYRGVAFQLLDSEEAEEIDLIVSLLEKVDFDPDNPYVIAGLLVLCETAATWRQFSLMQREMAVEGTRIAENG